MNQCLLIVEKFENVLHNPVAILYLFQTSYNPSQCSLARAMNHSEKQVCGNH